MAAGLGKGVVWNENIYVLFDHNKLVSKVKHFHDQGAPRMSMGQTLFWWTFKKCCHLDIYFKSKKYSIASYTYDMSTKPKFNWLFPPIVYFIMVSMATRDWSWCLSKIQKVSYVWFLLSLLCFRTCFYTINVNESGSQSVSQQTFSLL